MNPADETDALLARFEAALRAAGLRASSVEAYLYDVVAFAAWREASGHHLGTATEADVRAYLAARRAGGARDASCQRGLVALRRFFKTLGDRADPTRDVRLARAAPRYALPPTTDALAKLTEDLGARWDWRGARDLAILQLLARAGLTVSELVALRLDALDVARRHATVGRRVVGLDEPTHAALEAWLARRTHAAACGPLVFLAMREQPRGLIRQSVWKMLGSRARAAGIAGPAPSPRTLRAAALVARIGSGATPAQAAHALGVRDGYPLGLRAAATLRARRGT